MKKALAFDIGGTKIYSTIIDETGSIIAEIDKFSTPKSLEEIINIYETTVSYIKKIKPLEFISTFFFFENSYTTSGSLIILQNLEDGIYPNFFKCIKYFFLISVITNRSKHTNFEFFSPFWLHI